MRRKGGGVPDAERPTSAPNSSGTDLAAFEVSRYNWTRAFRQTNGEVTTQLGVYATTHASIAFSAAATIENL